MGKSYFFNHFLKKSPGGEGRSDVYRVKSLSQQFLSPLLFPSCPLSSLLWAGKEEEKGIFSGLSLFKNWETKLAWCVLRVISVSVFLPSFFRALWKSKNSFSEYIRGVCSGSSKFSFTLFLVVCLYVRNERESPTKKEKPPEQTATFCFSDFLLLDTGTPKKKVHPHPLIVLFSSDDARIRV